MGDYLTTAACFLCDGDGASDGGMAFKCVAYVPKLDAVTADLHLPVITAQKLQCAILPEAAEITGSVKPLLAVTRNDEGIPGPFRIAPIAIRKTTPADMQLPGDAVWSVCAVTVENPVILSGERPAIGD